MDENDSLIDKNLTALQQLLTAVALIDKVNETDTEFTNSLLPDSTVNWLMDVTARLDDIALKIGAA